MDRARVRAARPSSAPFWHGVCFESRSLGRMGVGGAGLLLVALVFAAEPSPRRSPLIYVSNERSGNVTVIDSGSDRVVATVAVGSRLRGIQAAADGRRVWVAVSDRSDHSKEALVAIDTSTQTVVERHACGIDPEQFALTPDGKTAVIANEDAAEASVLDLASGRIRAALPVGTEPEGVGVSPDGRFAWVTAETANSVSVIDLASLKVAATVGVDQRPRVAQFSRDGKLVYVSCEIAATVLVLDAQTRRMLARIPLMAPEKPEGIAFSPDGGLFYVATSHGNTVAVVDAKANRIEARIPTGKRPWGLAILPDGSKLYTANGLSNDVTVIEAETRRVVATIPAGQGPWGVAVALPR